ncbi:uncharacterized protein EKO05_0007437 [Ascochyta rabiei]|uniref:uncharacterized protein n=1 Tax=Didymella rabiei TaxID=5454 RepID=UPI0021FBC01C|nr:uncharacterized protein EKO05_0007437 [Ascochyta rabiei]UPX17060.1 hypothetical protein EKO05_0007437 [Ascochyta rabiei]
MACTKSPRWVVLRFNAKYDLDEPAIIDKYLTLTQSGGIRYFIHSIPPRNSSKAHTVLDLHCDQHQNVKLDDISYEVFLVQKKGDFVLEQLDNDACKKASRLCRELDWGTDRR